jgi:hypothetical protein
MHFLALFGIENGAVNTAVNLIVLFLAVLWLALVFYTYKDAVRRIGDPVLVVSATLTSLIFPFVGTVVYLILRPPEYLEDVRERELEIAATEARLLQIHELTCPYCAFPAEKSFLRCPNCLKRLKEPCATCRKPLDPRWRICPYCEAEVGQAGAQRRRRAPAAGARQRPAERAGPAERAAAPAPASPGAAPAAGPPRAAVQQAPRGPEGQPVARPGPDGRETVARPPTPQAAPQRPPTR